jgi:hypothetical protein
VKFLLHDGGSDEGQVGSEFASLIRSDTTYTVSSTVKIYGTIWNRQKNHSSDKKKKKKNA